MDPNETDEISEIARRRREAAEREAATPRPSYVTAVEHSELIYYWAPSAVPFRNVPPGDLVSSLDSMFGLTLSSLDISPLLAKTPRDHLLAMTEEEQLADLVKGGSVIKFEGGKFPLRNDFVAIPEISMNYESLLVKVGGVTSVADAIAQDVLELQWKLAGSTKRWEDIKDHVLMKGYGTATRVELGELVEKLVEPKLLEAVSSQLTEGRAVARHMGQFKPNQTATNELVANVFFDDLVLKISRYEPATGSFYQSDIRFSVTARNDNGTGRVLFTTEMDYDNHLAVLDELVEALKSA